MLCSSACAARRGLGPASLPCSKTLIGDYLGERDDFNLKVMHSYVDALDFTEMDFDEAIRWGS